MTGQAGLWETGQGVKTGVDPDFPPRFAREVCVCPFKERRRECINAQASAGNRGNGAPSKLPVVLPATACSIADARPGGPIAKHQPSPEGLGINPEDDLSAVGAALNPRP
jgi:hypothetical protein